MRLESSLYSSRSGIQSFGQAIAVVGDNIANVNTVGFKKGRGEFSNLMPDQFLGGNEGDTIGNGVKLARVRNIYEQGVADNTSRPLDMMIEGNDFFVVGSADEPRYTRSGNFSLRPDGTLITIEDQPVLGITDGVLGEINISNIDQTTVTPTTEITLSGNVDASLPIAEPADFDNFADIQANASYIANFSVVDSLGQSIPLQVSWFKTAAGQFEARIYGNSSNLTGAAEATPVLLATLNPQFNANGQLTEVPLNVQVNSQTNNGGNIDANIGLNFTSFAATSGMNVVQNDGIEAGSVIGFDVNDDGFLLALLDNGDSVDVAQIALAKFTNREGLEKAGDNILEATQLSGDATYGNATTAGFSKVVNGTLEGSNVDIAEEFVELIVFQRAYQANSQQLSATNDLMKDTIQLIRA